MTVIETDRSGRGGGAAAFDKEEMKSWVSLPSRTIWIPPLIDHRQKWHQPRLKDILGDAPPTTLFFCCAEETNYLYRAIQWTAFHAIRHLSRFLQSTLHIQFDNKWMRFELTMMKRKEVLFWWLVSTVYSGNVLININILYQLQRAIQLNGPLRSSLEQSSSRLLYRPRPCFNSQCCSLYSAPPSFNQIWIALAAPIQCVQSQSVYICCPSHLAVCSIHPYIQSFLLRRSNRSTPLHTDVQRPFIPVACHINKQSNRM